MNNSKWNIDEIDTKLDGSRIFSCGSVKDTLDKIYEYTVSLFLKFCIITPFLPDKKKDGYIEVLQGEIFQFCIEKMTRGYVSIGFS